MNQEKGEQGLGVWALVGILTASRNPLFSLDGLPPVNDQILSAGRGLKQGPVLPSMWKKGLELQLSP